MLNTEEYTKLLENVGKIEGYLNGKQEKIREPISIRFGDDEKVGYTTRREYRLNIDASGFEVADNHDNIYKFECQGTKPEHAYYRTIVYLYTHKQCTAPERMMIKLLRDWQEIKSAINVALRKQQEIRDMIHTFTL